MYNDHHMIVNIDRYGTAHPSTHPLAPSVAQVRFLLHATDHHEQRMLAQRKLVKLDM